MEEAGPRSLVFRRVQSSFMRAMEGRWQVRGVEHAVTAATTPDVKGLHSNVMWPVHIGGIQMAAVIPCAQRHCALARISCVR